MTLVQEFCICISKSDMATLTGHLTWLNDQVYYMHVCIPYYYLLGSIYASPSSTCHVMSCDQIINFYFYCVQVQQDGTIHTSSYLHYTFLPKANNGYEGVRKWTKHICMLLSTYACLSSPSCMQVDIFECGLALIPIHSGCHWSLVV